MKNAIFCALLLICSRTAAFGQTPSPTPAASDRGVTDVKIVELPKPTLRPIVDSPGVAASVYRRPDARTRSTRYFNSIVGPFALARQIAGAGISTWRNSPEEWGDRWEGFGRRVASNFGRNAIKQTAIFGLDEAFKYDSAFYRSKNKSVGARIRNALISPVTARTESGRRVVGVPRLVGTYVSTVAAYETWFPSRYDWKDGVRSGTISLGFNAAFNLFKEFVWKK